MRELPTARARMMEEGARLFLRRAYAVGHATESDSMMESHQHDCLEILYVHCEQCRFFQGDRLFFLGKHDLVLYDATLPHRVEWLDDAARPLFGLAVACRSDVEMGLSCADLLRNAPTVRILFEQLDDVMVFHGAREIFSALRDLSQEIWRDNDPGYETLLLHRLFLDIARLRGVTSDTASNYVEQACRYIDARFATIQNIEEIAGALGLTKGHLQRLFTAQTGRAIWRYLTAVRMQQAERLVLDDSLSIGEIGAMVGIHSRQNFHALFRKAYGLSPSMYRKLQSKYTHIR